MARFLRRQRDGLAMISAATGKPTARLIVRRVPGSKHWAVFRGQEQVSGRGAQAQVCAVNSIIAELRWHGAQISCQRRKVNGGWRFYYTMTKAPGTKGPGKVGEHA